jgi:hypothetical protein
MEDQEHLGAPATEAAHRGDLLDHLLVAELVEAIELELAGFLDEPIGELPRPLTREEAACWLAGVLRGRMNADVGIVTPGQAFSRGLAGGTLRRGPLWEVCDSTSGPGVAQLSGRQLAQIIARGRDPNFAASTAGPLRGRPRGVLQVSGPSELDPGRTYAVAGTDWELEPYGGLVESEWKLDVRYDFPTIVREAIEEHFAALQSV